LEVFTMRQPLVLSLAAAAALLAGGVAYAQPGQRDDTRGMRRERRG
jgi:hypothetical protein